ncbi:SLC13/DASS family transporter [Spongiibacter sp. KMU-158]|uniref:SLC13/DASS family transporter n=1 Tax=Spongiibacter pelagi TaxID=2760804 RepID=A0A927BY03_9GAMM|nr:SLC13 family permease [Spongiibacter pelagi]MBD2857625.1 SLC13/DASS family transporter [Spongiibacter pelagi]
MTENTDSEGSVTGVSTRKPIAGIVLGPLLLLLSFIFPSPESLSDQGWHTLALALWMASWWALEIIPIPATALLPLVAFPLLEISALESTAKAYSHPVIYLFMGGFILGIALQRWNLHRRLALLILLKTGSNPRRQLAGFMLATAFLSMWVSNTATSIMMLPIALSVISLEGQEKSEFATALLLAVAYSASLGGIATLIGTPPNALLAAYLERSLNMDISFASWMLVGLPVAASMLVFTWWWLSRPLLVCSESQNSSSQQLLREQLLALGAMSPAEKRVLAIFAATALLWICRPLLSGLIPGINDSSIAILAGLSLFLMPSGSGGALLNWKEAEGLPWGILLLFGGGLALASAIQASGLADWISSGLQGFDGWPVWLLMALVVTMIIFLTELTSNTATTASFLPLLGAFALAQDSSPLLFTVPAAIAASCAFMMPVATPPNAVIFGSGKIQIAEMMRQGLVLNLVGVLVVTAISYAVVTGFWL